MKIIRVFPRRTKATPIDIDSRVGYPGLFDEADEIHISVTFIWDLPEVERLEKEWKHIAPTKIGGPATGMRGEDFIPGKYIRPGYIITSRGCPNKCWFCSVWKREGDIRELPITEGWNILDDNLLACSEEHIHKVFDMLEMQKHPMEFTGGLEAARLMPWHAEHLYNHIKPKQIFFAYDTLNDRDPLYSAGKLLKSKGFKLFPNSHILRAYVLIGYPKDTINNAETRLIDCMKAGFMPMAMLYKNNDDRSDIKWRQFQRQWARPAIISHNFNDSQSP